MPGMTRYIDVVLNVPVNQAFTYKVPQSADGEELEGDLFGRRVEVRFGNRKMPGIISASYEELPGTCAVGEERIRPAIRFIDKEPILTRELLSLAEWMSAYYLSPIGEAVFTMIPSGRRETDSLGFSFLEEAEDFTPRALSDEQLKAVEGILGAEKNSSAPSGRRTDFHYLYGMTGSGKTEVFLSAAERVLSRGKGVIYLVPEISLTSQVVEAVVRRFGNTAAVLHSGLTPSQKLNEWKRILSRDAQVVIGARSAVFAPVPNVGLIIIDEEHDGSYKAGSSPRYHARQVAMHRASTLGIPLVMGSATPSVEAWKSMSDGSIKKHTLTRRLAGGAMPHIESVNLSHERRSDSCLSSHLIKEMRRTLDENRQIILFLNRRGFTHFFRCSTCGYELKCRNCSVSMTYHRAEKRLRCHYCGYTVSPPAQCPECGSLDVGYSGFGTEYIEAEVRAKFPSARLLRVDTDSLSHKGELKEKLDAFKNGEADILLGTQMVAKGLNFPGLQLVGVVMADTALHLPDFRAAERTFALITQVAGRAGRFFPDGKVIVQSYSPEREPIAMAVKGDTESFYAGEIMQREILSFPPFVRLLRLVFRSQVPGAAETAAYGAAQILRSISGDDVDVLGPSACPLEKIAQNFRHQVIMRSKSIKSLQKAAGAFMTGYSAPKNVYIEIDVDPVNLL